jgi:hypothetical protein
MFFRVIAFIVGLIAVIAGLQNYDSELATAPVPIITGALVMLIAVFNLMPRVKRCHSCNKKLPQKAEICHYCKAKQPPAA